MRLENKLWDLERLTNGEYAALHRAAGMTDLDAAAWRAFYRVDFGPKNGETQRFAALCMSCLWRKTDEVTVMSMEECLRQICWSVEEGKPTLRTSMAKRVDTLLETEYSEDGFFQGKLLNLIKIIHSDGRYKPDFEKLADDLIRWNSEKRYVQRRWLRTIYYENHENTITEEENNHDA